MVKAQSCWSLMGGSGFDSASQAAELHRTAPRSTRRRIVMGSSPVESMEVSAGRDRLERERAAGGELGEGGEVGEADEAPELEGPGEVAGEVVEEGGAGAG